MASKDASDEAADEASDEASADAANDDGHRSPLTAIVVAMEEEAAALRALLIDGRPASVRGARVTVGRLGGARVALAVTGDGPRNARRGLAGLLAALPVRRIIIVGVAGGLSPALNVGALVIGGRIIDEGDGRVYSGDAALVDAAARACGAPRGIAVSATRIADTIAEKQRLRQMATRLTLATAPATTTGPAPQGWQPDDPSSAAAVVDLESAAFVAAATRAGLPWLVLRAVSDTAADSVPALLNQSRDDGGAVRRGSVVRGLLTNPGALLPLLALRERVRTCADLLAQGVERIMIAMRALDGPSVSSPVVVTGEPELPELPKSPESRGSHKEERDPHGA